MAGFTSPNIMFLNTYDTIDRRYMAEIAPKLVASGYTDYVEFYAGGFAMPVVMASAGIKPERMRCYDISLYSSILGYAFSGKDLVELDVRKNGKFIDIVGMAPTRAAAALLYEQALARMEKNEEIQYYRNLVRNLKEQREYHIEKIEESVKRMDAMLHGMYFENLYIWDALEKERNSENTFIVSNPPTYPGAYEKFFDTNGRVTWKGDSIKYSVWYGKADCPKFMAKASDAKPLVFLLQHADKGKAATKRPVSSRYLSLTQNVYYNSNRPDEVKKINGLKETTANEVKRKKSKYPIMPKDHIITKESSISVFVEETQIAEYYRNMWLHRITGKAVTLNLCVVVDGYLAGFIGMDFNPLVRSYNDKTDFIILSYATAAPSSRYRTARLLVHIAKSKKVLENALSVSKIYKLLFYTTQAVELCTVEYSRFHEVKGLRGLMKIRTKKHINDGLNALTYFARLNDKNEKECLSDWIEAEEKYNNGKQQKDM